MKREILSTVDINDDNINGGKNDKGGFSHFCFLLKAAIGAGGAGKVTGATLLAEIG